MAPPRDLPSYLDDIPDSDDTPLLANTEHLLESPLVYTPSASSCDSQPPRLHLRPMDVSAVLGFARAVLGQARTVVEYVRTVVWTLSLLLGVPGWSALLGATFACSVFAAILGTTWLEERGDLHAYFRFWAVGLWPGLVAWILGNFLDVVEAHRAWAAWEVEEKVFFLQGLWCRLIKWAALSFASSGFSYLDKRGNGGEAAPPARSEL